MSKPRIIKDYDKLTIEIQEQIKLAYPYGFTDHLIKFTNVEGKLVDALPFESEDYHYLVRMTPAKADSIIEDDIDFDDDGNLKQNAKNKYAEKYEDAGIDIGDLESMDEVDELDFDDDDDGFGDGSGNEISLDDMEDFDIADER